MKKKPSKTFVTAIIILAALPCVHVAAQITHPPTTINNATTTVTLTTASDNYEILEGTLVGVTSGHAIASSGTPTMSGTPSPWYVKNSGSVTTTANSGMYFSYDAVVTNSAEGLISSANSTASQAGIYFTSAAAGSVENSGTIIGGLKGINFGNTSRQNTVVNHAGALIYTSVNATNGGAIYSANNNTVSVTNAGYIWGALRGLHLGGASTVVNTGTIRGDSGIAIMFNSTAVSSTLTLNTGSEIIGDIVSNAGLLNHIILAGTGSENDSFIGAGGDSTKGFSTLTMDGADWTLSGTVHLTNATANALTVTAGRLTLAGDTILATVGGGVTISNGGTLQIGDNGAAGSLVNPTLGAGVMPDILNDGAFAMSRSDDITLTNAISGAGVIVQAGSGVLTLAGNNTHTGGVRIDSGTLAIVDDAKLGAVTGALTLNGGVARYDVALATARALELAGGGIIDTNGNDITLSGAVSGTGSLTKTGAGLLELAGANTSTGATTILSGTLQGNIGSGPLTVNTAATYKVAAGTIDAVLGNIAGAGTVDLNNANLVFNVASGTQTYEFAGTLQNGNNLRKTGTGALDIGSHSFIGELSATGTTFVEGGLLKFDSPAQIGTNLILGGATTTGLVETDFSAWTQDITLAGAGGGLSIASGSQALAITVAGSGDFVKDGAGTLDMTGATMSQTGNTRIENGKLIANTAALRGDTTIAATALLEINQVSTGTYDGDITGDGSLIKNGAGEAVLTGANAYMGDTTVNAGTLTGNIGIGTLTVNSGATYKVADGVADFLLSGILGSGTINLNTANLTFDVASGTNAFNFTGALTGGNQLIKIGAGTLELQSAAALTNGVAIKNGTLKLADQSYVNAPVTLGDTASVGLIEYTGAMAWTKNITLTGLGGGFTVATGSQTFAASTTIAGTGDFIKDGSGALDITAASVTYTGNTRIDDGKLIAAIANLKGDTSVAAGATLELNQTATGTYAGDITGGGSLVKDGTGEAILTGNNNYAGDTTVNAGTLTGNIGTGTLTVNTGATYKVADSVTDFTLSGILGSGTINLNSANVTFDIASGTNAFSFAGALTGGNQLVKTGAGTLELQSAVVLTNGVAIKNGTLRLADQSYINAPVTLGDATTVGIIEYTGASAWTKNIVLTGMGGGFAVGSGTQTLAASTTIAGTGDFIKDGAGTLDITAASVTYVGNTRIDDGKLISDIARLKGDTSMAAGATLELNQTATGTYAGNITGGGSLIKNGEGEAILTGANTYTGDTTINEGTLGGNIGTGTLTVNTGATYKVADGITDFSLTGILGTGTVNLNAASLTLDVASGTGIFNFTGALTGGDLLIKTGAGTIELQTAAALTNGVAIKNGTLRLADQSYINAPVTLGDTASVGLIEYTGATPWNKNITLTGAGGGFTVATGSQTLAITIAGTGDFVKAGAGTLDITAATMAQSGNTRIDDGKLIAAIANLNGDTTIAAGAMLELNQAATATYAGNITGGGSLIKNGAGEAILTGANTYAGDTTVNAGTLSGNIGLGTLTVNAGATYKVADGITDFSLTGILGSGTINLNAANLTLDVATGVSVFNFTGEITGGNQFIKTGAGTIELQTAAALTNGVAVQNGTLRLADQSFINAPITLGGTTTGGIIQYTGTDAWAKNIVLAGVGGGFSVTSGTQALAAGTAITGNGSFYKFGAGTLDITDAAADHTGGTQVTAGWLIGNASTIRGNTRLYESATLEFNQTTDGIYSGNISGTGALVKTGVGTLSLTGANTQTGNISILEGAVSGNTSSLRVNIVTFESTAVIFDQASDGTYAAVITGTGALIKEGGGKLTLTGANRPGGGTRINAGALQISASNLSGPIENNAMLIFEQATNATYSGIISGPGQLQKSGGGTLTLSGSSTYSGATLITQGVLRASSANRLSPNSHYHVFGNLATLDLGTGNQTIAGLANTGTIILSATINPDAGIIKSANRLTITGDASGNGKLLVRITEDTTVGPGDGTTQRVLVKINGADTSAFTGELDKRYVDGAYEWGIVRGADGQSYDLKSNAILSPEVPAATALPAIAQLMSKAGIDTLAQRLGDMRDAPAGHSSLWFRGIYREDTIQDSILDGLKVRTSGGQAGMTWSYQDVFTPKARLDLGVLLTMAYADARFQNALDLDGDATGIGFFATYRAGTWYADLLLNMAYDNYKLQMRDGSDTLKFRGRTPSAVIEAGKQLKTPLGIIEPQVQVAYQYNQINKTTDAFDRVYTPDSTDLLNAHAGIRWHKVYAKPDSASAIIPSLRVRYGYEYFGESRVQVAGEEFTNELRGSQLSIDGGFTWWLNRSTGLYANFEYASGKAHNSLSATAGLRVSW